MCSETIYDIPLISRSEAIEAEEKTYFTGKPCPLGHIRERFVSNFGCLGCLELKNKERNDIRKEKTRQLRENNYIEKSSEIHQGKYDYSKFHYTEAKKKTIIICPTHGEFHQTPDCHSRGRGCPSCNKDNARKRNTKTLENFIQDARTVHGDRYNYDGIDYTSAKDVIGVTCQRHGVFQIKPEYHLLSPDNGCQQCLQDSINKKRRAAVIEKCRLAHGGFYTYNNVGDFHKGIRKITITCKLHGDFDQHFDNHIYHGHGCPTCASHATIDNMPEEEKSSKYFLYQLRFTCGDLIFEKIGVTKHENIEFRFRSPSYNEYDIEVIRMKEGRKEDILLLEMEILQEMEMLGKRYKLKKNLQSSFAGWTECYFPQSYDPIDWFVE